MLKKKLQQKCGWRASLKVNTQAIRIFGTLYSLECTRLMWSRSKRYSFSKREKTHVSNLKQTEKSCFYRIFHVFQWSESRWRKCSGKAGKRENGKNLRFSRFPVFPSKFPRVATQIAFGPTSVWEKRENGKTGKIRIFPVL